MEHIKSFYTPRIFWYILLVVALVVFPLFSSAEQHDTEADFGETVEKQNQSALLSVRDWGNFMADYDTYLIFVGIILLLIFNLLTHRSVRRELNNLEKDIKTLSDVTADLRSRIIGNTATLQILATIEKDIKTLLDVAAEHQSRIIKDTAKLQTLDAKLKEATTPSPVMREPLQSESMPPALRKFCDLYNASKANELQAHYQPLHRIGVVNALERRNNPNELPRFETNEAGNFLACYIESEGLYAVVPVYGLTLEYSIYGPGAFGEVFDCPNFNFQHYYQDLKVIRPALFESDSAQLQWTLKEKGELNLGSSE